jgi:hypothetical protein
MTADILVPKFSGSLGTVTANMKNTKHTSKILRDAKIERVEFDPTNLEHQAAYKVFQTTGKWVIHFHTQWPYQSVVSLAQDKLLTYFLRDVSTDTVTDKLPAKVLIAA